MKNFAKTHISASTAQKLYDDGCREITLTIMLPELIDSHNVCEDKCKCDSILEFDCENASDFVGDILEIKSVVMGESFPNLALPAPKAQQKVSQNVIGSLFATSDEGGNVKRSPKLQKIALEDPNKKTNDSFSNFEEIPKEMKKVYSPEVNKFITSLDELTTELKKARTKVYDGDDDIEKETHPLRKAALLEEKERFESVDRPAFIVNDSYASLSINDLGLTLPLNSPLDISRISAKKISNSRELFSLIEKGMVKFVPKEKISFYEKKVKEVAETDSYDVYSSPEEAEDALYDENSRRRGSRRDEVEEVDDYIDLDGDSEHERIIRETRGQPSQATSRKTVGNVVKKGKSRALSGSSGEKNKSVSRLF